MRCDACTSYEPWDGGVGRCHFMPPQSIRDARNELWTPFPVVCPDWWCSQHQQKPDVAQQLTPVSPPPQHHPAEVAAGAPATYSNAAEVEDDF